MERSAGRTGALALLLTLALAADRPGLAQDAGKSYELDVDWRAVEGHRSEVTLEANQKMRFCLRSGAKTLKEDQSAEELSATAVEEILKVSGSQWTEARWTFSRAVRRLGERHMTLGFEGKTVLVSRSAAATYQYEDGQALKGEDLEAIRKIVPAGRHRRDVPDPAGKEMFAPTRAVRVGDSWNPDFGAVARHLFRNDAEAIDTVRSSGSFNLRAVQSRSGSEFGSIDGRLDLRLRKMGPLRLDHPLTVRLSTDIEACVDGTSPDGTLRMRAELNGNSGVTSPDGKQSLVLEIELDSAATYSRRTLKDTLPRK